MDVFLVRHTRTVLEEGTCYGSSDVALAPTAADDIDRTLRQLPGVDVVHTSPALRCIGLAAALGHRDRCVYTIASELRELSFGVWEGRPWSAIDRAESDYWAEDPWNRAPPQGESEGALWQRVEKWYRHTLSSTEFQNIAVVAHGGSLRALRCLLLGLPPTARWAWTPSLGSVAAFSPRSLRG